MIGEIRVIRLPYYDKEMHRDSFKVRPALILAKADADDYVILPVSSVTHKENVNIHFDVEVEPELYPRLKLKKTSYIRTHKQTVAHRSNIGDCISDLKGEYEELWLHVLELGEEFSKNITEQALS